MLLAKYTARVAVPQSVHECVTSCLLVTFLLHACYVLHAGSWLRMPMWLMMTWPPAVVKIIFCRYPVKWMVPQCVLHDDELALWHSVEYESVMNSLPSGGKISFGDIAIVSWRCWIVLACF